MKPAAAAGGLDHVVRAAERLGIDEQGLGKVDWAAVWLLVRRRKLTGARAIAARLGIDIETYLNVHEPWLERLGFIERTPEGRIATENAREPYRDLAVK